MEWLRFVRGFGEWSDTNPFMGDADTPPYFLFLNAFGQPTSTGRIAYTESYFRRHPSDWGLDIVFRVFLDNAAGWARIECYDENLVGACELTLAKVEESYKEVA